MAVLIKCPCAVVMKILVHCVVAPSGAVGTWCRFLRRLWRLRHVFVFFLRTDKEATTNHFESRWMVKGMAGDIERSRGVILPLVVPCTVLSS